jgi:predicted secreted protein
MALAGYNSTLSIATGATSVTYAAMDGAISFSLSDSQDMLDTTDLADGRFRRRIVGLRDLSLSIDGDVELADPAYLRIKGCYTAGTVVYAQVTADGTNGVVIPCLVESLDRSTSVDGKVEISVSLQLEAVISPFEVGSGF